MRLPSRMLLVMGLSCWAGVLFAQAPPPPTPSPAVGGTKEIVTQQPRVVKQAEEPQRAVTTETAPQPMASESVIYCFGYLGNVSEPYPVDVGGADSVAGETE